jgi:hypothetical protein
VVRNVHPADALHDALELVVSRPNERVQIDTDPETRAPISDIYKTSGLDVTVVDTDQGRRTLRVELSAEAAVALADAIRQFVASRPSSTGDDDPLWAARQRGEQAKRDILASQGDMLDADEVAARLGCDVAEVERRRHDGLLLALPTEPGRLGFPAWQFADSGLLPGLEDVLRNMSVRSPWMRAQFFLSGDLRLDGRTPLEMLLRGEIDAVRRAGAAYGEQLAS